MSAWLSPGYWRHLESEPVSISLSAFQINNFFSVRKNGLICSLFSMVLESLPFHSPEFFCFSLVYLGSGAIYGWWPQQFWYGRILGKRDICLVLINLCLAGDTSRLRMLEHKDTGVCLRGGEGDALMLGHQGGGTMGTEAGNLIPSFRNLRKPRLLRTWSLKGPKESCLLFIFVKGFHQGKGENTLRGSILWLRFSFRFNWDPQFDVQSVNGKNDNKNYSPSEYLSCPQYI